MKISKKTIIIIIVAAVAAYLVWKKTRGSGSDAAEEVSVGSDTDTKSLDYILSHIAFNSAERNKIESLRQAAETSAITRQNIQAKAYNNGYSFDQQLVLEALWNLYHKNNSWTDDRGWKLSKQVQAL